MTVDRRSLAGLSADEKRRLLSRMLGKKAARSRECALSSQQERLWFLDQLEPGNPAYRLGGAFLLRGELDKAVLEASLGEIVRRHEPLRTTFKDEGGEPVQVAAPEVELDVPLVALEGLSGPARQREARRLVRRWNAVAFDLRRAPLLFAGLLRLAADETILVVVVHHIVFDGWSWEILLRELVVLYESFLNAAPSPLAPLSVEYRDYVHWQRRLLGEKKFEELMQFWKANLTGAPQVLELPADRARPALQASLGGRVMLRLPADLGERLKDLGRRNRASQFMVFESAFLVLLHRYTGQIDLVVGTPVANRDRRELEGLIGFFASTLVLRTDLSGDPSVDELLGRARETALSAFEHQAMPFEKIVETLQPDRDMSYSPIFQVLFVLNNAPRRTFGLAQVDAAPLEMEVETSKFDLTLEIEQKLEQMTGFVEYASDLFDRTTAMRLARHYVALLESMAGESGRRISELPLLAAADAQQILEWNDTAAPFRSRSCLHELIEEQIDRTPDSAAVVFEARTLTYRELERQSDRLASRLRRLGAGPGDRVGVFAERSSELVVALVSVLRAGCAYVPLDPDQPGERLRGMIEDSAAEVVLAQSRLAGDLPETGGRVIFLDGQETARRPAKRRPPRIEPHDLAYVIFTSGSTGRPKGAMNSHRAIVNRLEWMQSVYRLGPEDRVLQKTPMSFDVSVWEFFLPLMVGAKLVVARPGGHRDDAYLVDLIAREGVTTLHFVPSMLEVFIEAPGLERCPPPKRVIASGEALSSALVQRFSARWPAAALDNLYGPTEAAVDVTRWPCAAGTPGGKVPIGRPVWNTAAQVVDRSFRPVPPGASGELLIGGVQVARGYQGRPALTAERFVPDPFAPSWGSRSYRTGDRVRRAADGAIEFQGRFDHQVKLRGLRIELGEIETVLESHPEVRQALVMVRENQRDRRLVAYVVLSAPRPEPSRLREFLDERLPGYMVPASWVVLDEMPISPNGKVDRRALPDPAESDQPLRPYADPETSGEKRLAEIWAELLGVERVGLDDNFFDLGGHSLLMARLRHRLHELGADLPLVDLFRFPTVRGLAAHLRRLDGAEAGEAVMPEPVTRSRRRKNRSSPEAKGFAVIGMAGRFPGAEDLDQFWSNLCQGVESISTFTEDELIEAGVDPTMVRDPRFVPAAAVIDAAESFDAAFFDLSPREAQVMDPQHRQFLECSVAALEEAGYGACGADDGAVGVFAGSSVNAYFLHNLSSNPELAMTVGAQQVLLSNDKDHLATRVAYKLNLRGPAVNVQTACSTSMVAVHMACQSLLLGECDMALAGGVTIGVPRKRGYLHFEGGVLSPDGHCRAFDAEGHGSVGGEGVGVVVLKPLDEALAAGDAIHAVIRASAINNDGAGKVGYTAPSIEGQASVVAEALEMAGIDPESLGYVEAHGTGTRLGDPIEMAALNQVFRPRTRRSGYCAIGSVKTNIGHLDAAAGIAGLIKAVLAVKHGRVPPSLHFERPNPEIDFASSPFFVASELSSWPVANGPRRAGVSSFGMGGTNAHALLEQAPATEPSAASARSHQLLLISARSRASLERATDRFADFLRSHPDVDLADVAFTCQTGRRAFEHRRALVCRDPGTAAEALASRDEERLLAAQRWSENLETAFVFPGLGEHYVDMGRGLYGEEGAFREALDECARFLEPELGEDLREVLYPERETAEESEKGAGPDLKAMLRGDSEEPDEATARLNRTRLTHPALFSVEYALARLWMSWGIRPRAMLGYSIGEYVAACLAGVISLPDALALVARRAGMIDELAPGAMMAVPLPEEEVGPRLGEQLSLSAVNAPLLSVVGGPPEEVDALAERLETEGLVCRRLQSSHAFHSKMMRPIAERFRELVGSFELRRPAIPYISNVTGRWIDADAATDPDYWVRHLCQPVRFADGVRLLWREPDRVLLEVGPGQSLSSLALQNSSGETARRLAFPSLPGRFEASTDRPFLLRTLARLWLAGADVDWTGFHRGERRRRVHLPTYPFEPERHWIEAAAPVAPQSADERRPLEEWAYIPVWEEKPVPAGERSIEPGEPWLLFTDDRGLCHELAQLVAAKGAKVVTVERGDGFARAAPGRYRVDPSSVDDLRALVETLVAQGFRPRCLVHAWLLTPPDERLGGSDLQEIGFLHLVDLVRELTRKGAPPALDLAVVSNRMHAVGEAEVTEPEKATALGAVLGVPFDLPLIRGHGIDFGEDAAPELRRQAEQVVSELLSSAADPVVAYRGDARFVRGFEPSPLAGGEETPPLLRSGGVYWITGGLGGLALVTARYLARAAQARLVLTSRTGLPPRETWSELAHEEDAATLERIRAIRELEEMGSEVLVLAADVASETEMSKALEAVEERFGAVNGIVHTAGVPGSGLIQRKTRDMALGVMAPKVDGTRLLVELFRDRELDFLILYSSISSLMGGLGEADYCAGNAYLDALAESRPLGETVVTSINWDGWQEVGLGAEAERRLRADGVEVDLMGHGILPWEGEDVFGRLLARPVARIAVSTIDLFARARQGRRSQAEAIGASDSVRRQEEAPAGAAFGTTLVAARGDMEETLAGLWREMLGVEKIGVQDNFFELGGHSLLLVQMQRRLTEVLGVDLPVTVLFQYPTIRSLAEHLASDDGAEQEAEAPTRRRSGEAREIAILATVGRFPGARDVDEYWRNLSQGVESISRFSREELLEAGVEPEVVDHPSFVNAGGYLEDCELFDAGFFDLSPREAQVMDPQHRLFLECAYEALEAAGYGAAAGRGRVGVFAGSSFSTYLAQVAADPVLAALSTQAMISNDKFHLTTYASYKLNLRGPSFTVETACSTAMVALYLACQSLWNGDCDLALAGGVSLPVPVKGGYVHDEAGMLSPDGRCRAFDASAAGTPFGKGIGVVAVKLLERALEDGDPIRAVIKGAAINNDGAVKVGYTAPSVEGQASVIREAQEMAGVDPATIGYVEAHGTGTRLGDPIEVAALTQAFRRRTQESGYCALGSVKTNIGHLDTAAGAAGLIKTVMALEHAQVPPSLHFENPNPEIDFSGSPFFVPTELRSWPLAEGPRRAGVSAFGMGGTNVHVVLEQAPPREDEPSPARSSQLLVLSARSESALEAQSDRLATHLRQHPELDLADAAYTLQVGREAWDHRRIVVSSSTEDAARVLEEGAGSRVLSAKKRLERPRVALLFPGLGDQYVGMGRGLYDEEKSFREILDECAEILVPELETDIREVLYPASPARAAAGGEVDFKAMVRRGSGADDAADPPLPTALAQPLLFAFEYALTRLWMSWGIKPQAMLGYSLGEYVAAAIAGVFSLPDALRLVARRARMIQELAPGAMLAVPFSEEQVEPYLGEHISLSGLNGPAMCVVGGPVEEVAALERRLTEEGLACRPLQTTHAFHSPMMEPIVDEFRALVGSVERRAPRIPYLSNVTGRWIEAGEATDPDYWVQHLRRPVRFADGVAELWREPERLLLEVGPGSTLGSFALMSPRGETQAERIVVPTLRGRYESQDDAGFSIRSLGRLWLSGVEVDWHGFHAGNRRRRLNLPTYPFERQRYWVDAPARTAKPALSLARQPIEDWTYMPCWSQSPCPASALEDAAGYGWLLFIDSCGIGAALAAELTRRNCPVVTVEPGPAYERTAEGAYRVIPDSPEHYDRLLGELNREGSFPRFVAHLWTVTSAEERAPLEACLEMGYYSFLFLAQALSRLESQFDRVDVAVVSSRSVDVSGTEALEPGKAPLLAAAKVVSQEVASLRCRNIDLGEPAGECPSPARVRQLLSEIASGSEDQVVAYREPRRRWVRTFEPLALSAEAEPALRRHGVYMITGGLGTLGLLLARHLVEEFGARIVLLGRSGLPPRSKWAAWLTSHETADATAKRIRAVEELEGMGAEVEVIVADVTDRPGMEKALARVGERFGELNGVFHAAGVAELELLPQKSPDAAARVLAPKVQGSLVLSELLQAEKPDFLALYSSLSSVAGGVGMVDYAAANAFLDALAQQNSRDSGFRTLAINWGVWLDSDEVLTDDPSLQTTQWQRDMAAAGIRPREGIELLVRLLEEPLPQIVVSPRVLEVELHAVERMREEKKRSATGASRPALDTPYVEPRDSLEQSLVELWQNLFGFEPIGIHDNFYELGGHSLLGMQMSSRIRESFDVALSLDVMLGRPSVAELAAAILEMKASPVDDASLQELFAEVERMSEDDARVLLEGAEPGD